MIYDVAIVGAGPAGLTASIYASRYGMKNIVFGEAGGLTTKAHEIGNWLGTEKIKGFEFAAKAEQHARSYGAPIENTLVGKIEKKDENFILNYNGKEAEARTILLAMGSNHRHLEIPGEKEFSGKGVSYCATCDGFFYKDKVVAVIGGGNSAAQAAISLSELARKTFLIHRGAAFTAEEYWIDAIARNSKIESVLNTNVIRIKGSSKLEEIILDKLHENSDKLQIDGLFIEIGFNPNVENVKALGIAFDPSNFIIVDTYGRTNIAGIWAAGDITTGSGKFKQIVTASAEGAIAVHNIHQYLKSKF